MKKTLEYAHSHFAESLEELKHLVRIPSVSFSGFSAAEVRKSAEAVAALFRKHGLEHVEILEVPGAHPYVYADWIRDPKRPTLLLYAHHDVQPPGKEPAWKSPPFEPVEREGRLFGRGAADDKAGILVHLAAVSAYLQTEGDLPVNVRFLIEGEEEIGSEHLEQFLEKYRAKFDADVLVLTDTSNFDVGVPSITTSLRGIVAAEIELSVMQQSVHSGMWGGPGPDPVLALSKILASLTDDRGRIAIAGIYDDVRPLTATEEQSLQILDYSDATFREQAKLLKGVELIGDKVSPLVKMWRLPGLSVNAIQAGSRERVANVIHDSVWCKLGIRTVPDMDPKKVQEQVEAHLRKHCPWGAHLEIKWDAIAPWWVTNPEGPAFQKAQEALTEAFGSKCVFIGAGGSIPFVEPFARVLGGVPALLIGVEDPHTNAHSENESVHLGDLKKSIDGAIRLYAALAKG